MIGLARHEQQLVDARGEQAAPPVALAIGEALHDAGYGLLHVAKAGGPGVEGRQAVHQHYLAIEACEVLLVEALHQVLLVLLEALLEGGVEAAIGGLGGGFVPDPGHELQQRRPGILPRQHETARLDEVQPQLALAGVQIVGVTRRQLARRPLLEGLLGLPAGGQPVGGQGLQLGATQLACYLLAPLLVVEIQQRQVQQPLAGVVHQIHIEGGDLPQVPAQGVAGAVANFQAHLGHPTCRLGPGRRIAKQGIEAPLVGEGGNVGILLGNPAGAEDPPLALGIPQGQTAVDGGVLQLIDQRRDEGGLAAAGQAGDRQPDVAIPSPVHHLKGLVLQHRP